MGGPEGHTAVPSSELPLTSESNPLSPKSEQAPSFATPQGVFSQFKPESSPPADLTNGQSLLFLTTTGPGGPGGPILESLTPTGNGPLSHTQEVTAVPEPGSLLLLSGALALGARRLRSRA